MKSQLSEEVFLQIVQEWKDGMRVERIAAKYGISASGVYRMAKADEAARDGNMEELRKIARLSARIAEFAAKAHGLSLGYLAPAATAPAPDNTAMVVTKVLELLEELAESSKANTAALQSISTEMSALRMAVSGTRKDMNENLCKVTESINVNGDILTKEHDKIVDLMEAIKMNTKKLPAALRSSD